MTCVDVDNTWSADNSTTLLTLKMLKYLYIKVKVQVYNLISSLRIYQPTFTLHPPPPGHCTCSFVCHFNSKESIQSSNHFGALNLSYIVLIAISILPRETWYVSENPELSRVRDRRAGSDIGRVPRCNHCTTSPSKPRDQIVFCHFEIIINILVSSFRFIWIHMLWVYGHYKYFTLPVGGSTLDVRIWRLQRSDSDV